MTRITYSDPDDDAPHFRFGDVNDHYVEFPRGERVADVDVETALWAADILPSIRLVADLTRDYDELRKLAAAADTDEVSGNDDKLTLIEWLDGIDDETRARLYDEVGVDA